MNHQIRFLLTLASCLLATAPAAATEIRLRESVVVVSPVVRLGDVAEVVSADRALARQLAALPLMPSPAAGTERFLRQREVQDLLVAHGQNLTDIRFEGAAQVGISAPGAKVEDGTGDTRRAALAAGRIGRATLAANGATDANDRCREIRCIVESYLNTKIDQPATWRVSCDIAERHLALLDKAISPPTCRGGQAPWTGRQRFVVSFETAEGPVHVPVYADVENLSYSVVVAIRPIGRGDVITAANAEVRTVTLPPGPLGRRAPVSALESILGMQARQSIPEGQTIFSDQVQPPVMVKRGELITISSQGGGIRVRTTARAREDAVKGEVVQVESLETRERFDVRVIGPNEATIFAAVGPADIKPAPQIEMAQRPIPYSPRRNSEPVQNPILKQ